MPSEVNRFYAEGKTQYLADMDTVIGRVADVVGGGLTAARARIAQGKAEIQKYVAQLPEDLKQVGQEAEEKLAGQFEQLASDVESKQGELVDNLARKYVDARDALDSRIDEMKAANRGLVDKAIDAVAGVIKTIIQLKNMLLGVLAKAADVIGDIIADPIGFLGNLIDGIKSGLTRFVGNIATHLQEGLMGWLFGALGRAGITMPKTFDLAGILDLVLQVLGLTYAKIRAKAVKAVGEPAVARLEQTVEIFKVLMTEGVGGLWRFIKDKIGDLEELVLGQIKTFIIEKVIKAGITWLIAFMNPAAAFIKACKAIYDIVMFLIERGSEIMDFVRSILDSVGAIAKGAIGVVAEKIESSLSKALPLMISFLASLLGLGGISEKIRSVIEKVQAPITKAIDFVIGGVLKGAKKLGGWVKGKVKSVKDRFTGGGSDAQAPSAAVDVDPATETDPHTFKANVTLDGAQHEVEATSDGQVTMASANKGGLLGKAQARLNKIKDRDPKPTEEIAALERIIEIVRAVQTHSRKSKPDAPNPKWDQACRDLIVAVAQYGDQFNRKDIDPSGEPERDINELYAQCKHKPPSQYSRAKHWRGANEKERIKASDENGQFMWEFSEAEVAGLEKETLLTGDVDWRGDDAVHAYKTFGYPVGYEKGEKVYVLRAEISAKEIHSHPRAKAKS